MARSTFSSAAAAFSILALSQVGSARLDKPDIDPPIPSMDKGFFDNLAIPPRDVTEWTLPQLPQICIDEATKNNYSLDDVSAFDVKYNDCDEPWVMCRHKDADMSADDMADGFGRLPVGMRQWLRTIIGFPGNPDRNAYTYPSVGDMVIFGDGQNYPTLWAHEAAHALDWQGLGANGYFTETQPWTDAYDRDSAVTDSYGATNQQENFAQQTVVAIFDKVVPGQFGGIEPNWAKIFNQYVTIESTFGHLIVPGGTCEGRRANSETVCKPGNECPEPPSVGSKRGEAKARSLFEHPAFQTRAMENEHPTDCSFEHLG